MPKPESFDWAAFEYTGDIGKFPQLIDDLRGLAFQNALRSRPHLANDFAMMCIVSQYPHDALKGRRCLSDEVLADWRKKHGVARWTFGCGLYGSPEEVRFQRRYIRRALSRYGRVQFVGVAAEDTLYGRIVRKVAPIVNRLMGKSEAFMEGADPGNQSV